MSTLYIHTYMYVYTCYTYIHTYIHSYIYIYIMKGPPKTRLFSITSTRLVPIAVSTEKGQKQHAIFLEHVCNINPMYK